MLVVRCVHGQRRQLLAGASPGSCIAPHGSNSPRHIGAAEEAVVCWFQVLLFLYNTAPSTTCMSGSHWKYTCILCDAAVACFVRLCQCQGWRSLLFVCPAYCLYQAVRCHMGVCMCWQQCTGQRTHGCCCGTSGACQSLGQGRCGACRLVVSTSSVWPGRDAACITRDSWTSRVLGCSHLPGVFVGVPLSSGRSGTEKAASHTASGLLPIGCWGWQKVFKQQRPCSGGICDTCHCTVTVLHQLELAITAISRFKQSGNGRAASSFLWRQPMLGIVPLWSLRQGSCSGCLRNAPGPV